MFPRVRVAFVFSLLAVLFSSISALAKGSFSFVAINGPALKEEIRSTDPALTTDFFAFADFYRSRTKAPENLGTGYEITRYYVDGKLVTAFDSLHYYPETGFVYYDGIAGGGSSEYDGEWYTAKAEIRTAFESALRDQLPSKGSIENKQSQPNPSSFQARTILLTAILAGLAIAFTLVFGLRRSSAH